mmetsp:Transcript_81791/g.227745  ORF Transcript_81791/g.227745 Transcript_81791/m.227745 type:complete len:386 (-) Transcript_81791:195-1352(-)|eukprot:CAMPEP_0117511172 /NCGR_PEP_ID=MMETSP0784-20121206/28370_1 /TAXON_ID=39447 /ORGANISM="" /LENGTH=385 /DNA_ID=CAMNT_0005306835 /DNA_START=76 /DNA_END=1233 /DNA_ORIENTATION=+
MFSRVAQVSARAVFAPASHGARCFSFAEASSGAARWKLAAGVATAGATSFVLCTSQAARAEVAGGSDGLPPFTMDKPKFDQSTFYGRLMGMYDYIDPRTLFLSSESLKRSQDLVDEFKKTGKVPQGVTNAEMWQARKNVEVSIHPVTGEPIFPPGRMSAFVPMNVPLCAFMLMASTPPQVVFAQWLNQTYNVVNNYANRSGATVDWSSLLTSYGLAVGASVSIALSAGRLMKAVPRLQVMGPFVPYLAVISAGSANVSFTRMEEWRGSGIPIADKDGNALGMSAKAGQIGVLQTVLSRSCFLPIAPMVLPVLAMKALQPFLAAGAVSVVAECVLITGAIAGMLPVALAILPQEMEISTSSLEAEFQNLRDAKGDLITVVYANKGL